MSDININMVLQQMQSMSAMAENKLPAEMTADVNQQEFAQLLKDSINAVNNTQQAASNLATRFEASDPTVNLSDVMVAVQKASISFQAMTQVRNNLVSAYKDIMNMPV